MSTLLEPRPSAIGNRQSAILPSLPDRPKLTLGYIRTSTNRQDISLEVQTDRIAKAAEFHGTGPVSFFSAGDTSGRIPFLERNGETAEMLERARELAPECDVTIIVPKVDRLGRNAIDINLTVQMFDKLNVGVRFLDLDVDTRTPIGRMLLYIVGTIAEIEVNNIRERIQSALDQKRSQGQLTGSVPYGWNAGPTGAVNKKGKPILRRVDNLEEQQWLTQMLAWRAAGQTDWQIAVELNALGVKTKRAGETLTVVCDADTPGARENKSGTGYVITKPASGKWQAEQVTTLLNSKTVQDWLAAKVEPQMDTD